MGPGSRSRDASGRGCQEFGAAHRGAVAPVLGIVKRVVLPRRRAVVAAAAALVLIVVLLLLLARRGCGGGGPRPRAGEGELSAELRADIPRVHRAKACEGRLRPAPARLLGAARAARAAAELVREAQQLLRAAPGRGGGRGATRPSCGASLSEVVGIVFLLLLLFGRALPVPAGRSVAAVAGALAARVAALRLGVRESPACVSGGRASGAEL